MRVLKILAGAVVATATVHVGLAAAAPSEAAVLARIEHYCANPAPDAVAALVAQNGHSEPDPEGLALMSRPLPPGARQGPAKAWTIRDADTWWLRVGVAHFPKGPMTQCTLRVADLREAEMERLLRAGPQWTFARETLSGTDIWVREYHARRRDRVLLYTTKMIGPPATRRFHTFSVMGGVDVRKAMKR